MTSKTQLAFERRDLKALTRIGIRKCFDLHPPVSTDEGAENLKHAHRRYRVNRYEWIERWIARELQHPREGDTGSRLMTRLRWRLQDEIRKEYAARKRRDRVPRDRRNRREKLPSREELIDFLSPLDPPEDPVLCDLWERIIAAYPDWRLSTNRHLAAVFGVHHNVMASRRHALAVVMRQDLSAAQEHFLVHALRLPVGQVRKTDIRKVENSLGVLDRKTLVTTKRQTGAERQMDWHEQGVGTPQLVPVFTSLEHQRYVPPARCPYIYIPRRPPVHPPASQVPASPE